MLSRFTIIFALFHSITVAVFAQNTEPNKPATKTVSTKSTQKDKSADTLSETQAWINYMTPGLMHKLLMDANGNWNVLVTFWMTPGAQPTTMKAECTNRMILGDRYQESVHKGTMMDMPFEGIGICGYNNAKKVFQSTWVDNMGSGIMYMEGNYDESSNTITMKGESVDPATGKNQKIREVLKIMDINFQLMEMYITRDGVEFKNMEIQFSRK